MTTYGDVVEEVLSVLQGYTLAPDQMTYLTADLAADATSIEVAAFNTGSAVDPGLGAGLIEVGDELIWIHSADSSTSTLNTLPRGRGWRGSGAVEHVAGDTVVISPLVPRHRVKVAINDVLAGIWPTVYGVASDEFSYVATTKLAWGIPAEAEQILDVRYRDRLGDWQRVRQWEVERQSAASDFPTGTSLRLPGGVDHGSTVQVVYAKRPTLLVNETDDFASTGLSTSAKDVVVYGALARLVPALDAGRLGVQYVPADELDQPRQLGTAMALADGFNKQYAAYLQREQQALHNLYPARPHYTR